VGTLNEWLVGKGVHGHKEFIFPFTCCWQEGCEIVMVKQGCPSLGRRSVLHPQTRRIQQGALVPLPNCLVDPSQKAVESMMYKLEPAHQSQADLQN